MEYPNDLLDLLKASVFLKHNTWGTVSQNAMHLKQVVSTLHCFLEQISSKPFFLIRYSQICFQEGVKANVLLAVGLLFFLLSWFLYLYVFRYKFPKLGNGLERQTRLSYIIPSDFPEADARMTVM